MARNERARKTAQLRMSRARRARTLLRMSTTTMKTFLIEREIPGAAGLTHDQLRGITSTSNDAVASLDKPYKWLHSYVAGDKVYCVHEADDEEAIREHARRGGFPADLVVTVAAEFGPGIVDS